MLQLCLIRFIHGFVATFKRVDLSRKFGHLEIIGFINLAVPTFQQGRYDFLSVIPRRAERCRWQRPVPS
jgi:hypothetical protein